MWNMKQISSCINSFNSNNHLQIIRLKCQSSCSKNVAYCSLVKAPSLGEWGKIDSDVSRQTGCPPFESLDFSLAWEKARTVRRVQHVEFLNKKLWKVCTFEHHMATANPNKVKALAHMQTHSRLTFKCLISSLNYLSDWLHEQLLLKSKTHTTVAQLGNILFSILL